MLFFEPDDEKTAAGLAAGCSSLKGLVVFGGAGEGFTPFAPLLDHPPGQAATVSDSDPAVIIHTAAIQGKPRGAVPSHRNLAGEKGPLLGNFPPILPQLLDAQAGGECSLSSLKNVIGVELPETVKRFEGLGTGRFWLAYGQTETMGLASLCPNSERPGSAGRPGPLVDLKIADELDREVSAGQPGEILIRGPLVFEGYWGEEELTRHTLRKGWHHTGDVGRLGEEGFLWLVGGEAEKGRI